MADYSQKTRDKYATVHSGGESKFPIHDAKHARVAMSRLNQAKPPLTHEQKMDVIRRANKYLKEKHSLKKK